MRPKFEPKEGPRQDLGVSPRRIRRKQMLLFLGLQIAVEDSADKVNPFIVKIRVDLAAF